MAGSDICAMFCSCNWLSLCFHDCRGVQEFLLGVPERCSRISFSIQHSENGCAGCSEGVETEARTQGQYRSSGSWWLAVCVDSFGFVDFSFVLWDVSHEVGWKYKVREVVWVWFTRIESHVRLD